MILIKTMSIEDVSYFNEVRNLSKENLHDDSLYTLEESTTWFLSNNPLFFIIYEDERKIGYFRTSNLDRKNKHIYIGADLHPENRGKGLAYMSYKIFIPYIFQEFNLNKICLEVLSTNNIAYNLYKKLGFKTDGIKRQEIFRDGKYIDSIIMSILKEEYE